MQHQPVRAMNMKRLRVAFLAMLLTMPAMAQTDSAAHKHYVHMFPRLPFIKVEMDCMLTTLPDVSGVFPSMAHSSWMQQLIHPDTPQSFDDDVPQSVVIRKRPLVDSVAASKVQFHYTPGPPQYGDNGGMQWLRNEIVFYRMKNRQKLLAPIPQQRITGGPVFKKRMTW